MSAWGSGSPSNAVLVSSRGVRDDDGRYDVGEDPGASKGEDCQYQPNQRRVDVEIFCYAPAYSADHAVFS